MNKAHTVTLNIITYGLYKSVNFRNVNREMFLFVLVILQCWSYTFAHAPELERGAVSNLHICVPICIRKPICIRILAA